MGVEPAEAIVEEVRAGFRGRVVKMEEVLDDIKGKLKSLLAQPPSRSASPPRPTVIMVAGVNGAGKTTSIAKLAGMLQGEGKKVIWGPATPSAPPPSSN